MCACTDGLRQNDRNILRQRTDSSDERMLHPTLDEWQEVDEQAEGKKAEKEKEEEEKEVEKEKEKEEEKEDEKEEDEVLKADDTSEPMRPTKRTV